MTAPLAPLLAGWRSQPLPALDSLWAVPARGRAFAVAGLFSQLGETLLVVVPGETEAEELADDLGLFTDQVFAAPAWETLPFEHVSPNTLTMAARAEARHRLAGEPCIVVASVRSVIQRLSPSAVEPITASPGDQTEIELLTRRLADAGYHRTDRVEGRGEMAVRGGIVDVFPAQSNRPVRLDFWGDQVDETRFFSVASQRSEESAPGLVAYPARELRPDETVRREARELVRREAWAAS
ncbi:MAG: transcription-repair coupling factor, partial [Actinobacteria bacterium]|nr:transcription-repair coupling factor [Actinomycetota bacterium]